jgi:photosynthetic reaction center cytochrome c subunit
MKIVAKIRAVTAVGGVALLFALCIAAQAQQPSTPAPQAGAQQVRTAEQQFKNIQVLKGFPANQLVQSMHVIESSLGVNCEYCHVPQMFDKDDLKTKQTARKMISMVLDINKNTFGGQQVVTCYTCHRGSPQPVAMISPLPVANPMIPPPPPRPAPVLPSADQILAKYVQAIGGEQAIRNVHSRVIIATWDIPTGPGGEVPTPAQIEVDRLAPNLLIQISKTDKFTLSEGYDGSTAWTQNLAGMVTSLPNPDQQRAKRSADLYESSDLKSQYTKMEVRGIEKVNGHDAYVVVGIPEDDGPERLFFDVKTGLLLRKTSAIPTLFGDNPVQVDYDDYKDTSSGVKIPFLIHMVPGSPRSELWTTSTMKVQKVQDNVQLEAAKFVKPQSKPAPAQ